MVLAKLQLNPQTLLMILLLSVNLNLGTEASFISPSAAGTIEKWISSSAFNMSSLPTRNAAMTRMSAQTIRAFKLRAGRLTSAVRCVTSCLMESTCYYVTVDEAAVTCTLYAPGLVTYDVRGLKTFSTLTNQVSWKARLHKDVRQRCY